ncbi:MAG: hypothetical protein J5654_11230 [Victivallales bacterium]|nr:hypothetical protein [Victivallales bacterium]
MTNPSPFPNTPWQRGEFADDYAIRDSKNRVVARANCNLPEAADIAALLSIAPQLYAFAEFFTTFSGQAHLRILGESGQIIYREATLLVNEFQKRRLPEYTPPKTPES